MRRALSVVAQLLARDEHSTGNRFESEHSEVEMKMLPRRVLLASLALSTSAAGLGCAFSPHSYRFKIFVEIEVEGRRYSGYGVREAYAQRQWAWPDQGALIVRKTRGEAFWIDVPGYPTLFVTLPASQQASWEWNPDTYLTKIRQSRNPIKNSSRVEHLPIADLKPENLPELVYFRDISKESSGRYLPPNDITPAYGETAYITRATVERTREPLTRGIESKIPWLRVAALKSTLSGKVTTDPSRFIFNARFWRT